MLAGDLPPSSTRTVDNDLGADAGADRPALASELHRRRSIYRGT
jgi:hypothetical protein